MTTDRDAIQLAQANIAYAAAMLDVFKRGAEGCCVHKDGMPHRDDDSSCWISPISVPSYIEAGCDKISAIPLTEKQRAMVLTFTRIAANDLQAVLKLPNRDITVTSSLGQAQGTAKSVLPKIEQLIKTLEVA